MKSDSCRSLPLYVALVVILGASVQGVDPEAPFRLRVEYLEDPLGIDVRVPRFSWAVAHSDRGQAQIAYRILVELHYPQSTELVWDSGRVTSSKTVNIEYAGSNLLPQTSEWPRTEQN